MTISNNIKRLREKYGLTQAELGAIAGVTDKAVSTWERGEADPRMGAVERMASYFGIKKSEIIDDFDFSEDNNHEGRIPLLGSVPAGPEHWVSDDIEDWIRFEPNDPGEYVALRVSGSSMEPTMMDGDLVFVRLQSEVKSGDIAVVRVNGDEDTCKEVQVMDDGLLLIAHNPSVYKPRFYSAEQIERLPVQIKGKVVALKRDL